MDLVPVLLLLAVTIAKSLASVSFYFLICTTEIIFNRGL